MEENTKVNQEQLTELLYACYRYLNDNGLMEDFSSYTGIPMPEGVDYSGNIDDGSISAENSITIEEDGSDVQVTDEETIEK